MIIDYYLLDPTKNITALVVSHAATEDIQTAAAAIMAAEPLCEQVGFLSAGTEGADIRLDMAGGEFCGNAALSAAALYFERSGRADVNVSVSGCDTLIPVHIEKGADCYTGTVTMPGAAGVSKEDFDGEKLPLVRLPGISHFIISRPIERGEAERELRRRCKELRLGALGLMQLNEKERLLTPLVYVSGGDTLFWEQSCASGTAAVGIYLAERSRTCIRESFTEPGGSLTIECAPGERPLLTGTVRIVKRSYIEL